MSDLFKGRLMLLATASALALAIFAWGDKASAQDDGTEAGAEVSVEAEIGEEEAVDEGETVAEEGNVGEVTIGEVFDLEIIDDGSVTFEIEVIDPEALPEEEPVDFEGDPAVTYPTDPDYVLEDPIFLEDGEGVVDGELIDMPMILQSGAPELRSNSNGPAPLPSQVDATRKPVTESSSNSTCSKPLQNGFCVTN